MRRQFKNLCSKMNKWEDNLIIYVPEWMVGQTKRLNTSSPWGEIGCTNCFKSFKLTLKCLIIALTAMKDCSYDCFWILWTQKEVALILPHHRVHQNISADSTKLNETFSLLIPFYFIPANLYKVCLRLIGIFLCAFTGQSLPSLPPYMELNGLKGENWGERN